MCYKKYVFFNNTREAMTVVCIDLTRNVLIGPCGDEEEMANRMALGRYWEECARPRSDSIWQGNPLCPLK